MAQTFNKTIAFIAGSGLAQGLEDVLEDVSLVEHHSNEFGEVLDYYVGFHGNTRVVIMPRHGKDIGDIPERSPATLVKNGGYEANVWELCNTLNVAEVYGLSAVGSLDMEIPLVSTGTVVVPNSYIRGLAASQHTFGLSSKTIHTPMGESFDETVRQRAIEAVKRAGYNVLEVGTYIMNGGDTFETPAEIRTLDRLTGQYVKGFQEDGKPIIIPAEPNRMVGMTTIPELLLLKQMNIPFAAVCSNVNYAEGLSELTPVSHEQTKKEMKAAEQYLTNIVKEIILSYD